MAWGSGEGKFKSCSSGWWGWGRPGGWKERQQAQRVSEPLLQEQEETGRCGQACLPCRTPVWGQCRDLLHPVSWGPCRLPRKLSAFTEGPGLEETLLPLSPAAPGHFLAWLPALLNTRPGFPSSVKASGSPAPQALLAAQGLEAAIQLRIMSPLC